MEKTILILLLAVAGTMANQNFGFCDVEKCRPELPDLPADPLELDVSDLEKFCPPLLKSLKCMFTVITFCTGSEPSELAESENEALARPSLLLVGVNDVLTDLCDDGSALNRGLRNGIECFGEKFEDIQEECMENGQKVYLEFKEPVLELLGDDDEIGYGLAKEADCLVMGYTVACATAKLRESCSTETAETFSQIVKKSNMVKVTSCSRKDLRTLKTEFVDYLETQGGNRDVLSAAFDFRKKK